MREDVFGSNFDLKYIAFESSRVSEFDEEVYYFKIDRKCLSEKYDCYNIVQAGLKIVLPPPDRDWYNEFTLGLQLQGCNHMQCDRVYVTYEHFRALMSLATKPEREKKDYLELNAKTTVSDLIEMLQGFPQDLPVMINGCFGGTIWQDKEDKVLRIYEDHAEVAF